MTVSLTIKLTSTIYYQDIVLGRETVPPVKSYFVKISCYDWTENGRGCYFVRKQANVQRNKLTKLPFELQSPAQV